MGKVLARFSRDESGATAIEYGVLIGFIALAAVLALESVGIGLEGLYAQITTMFASAGSPPEVLTR